MKDETASTKGTDESGKHEGMVNLLLCREDAMGIAQLVLDKGLDFRGAVDGFEICRCCGSDGDARKRPLSEAEENELRILHRLVDVLGLHFEMEFEGPAYPTRRKLLQLV